MTREYTSFSALTTIKTTDWSVGQRVLESFLEVSERLTPEYLYQWENKIGPFVSVQKAKPYWAQTAKMEARDLTYTFPVGLRWKRTRVVKYDAEITHTDQDTEGKIIQGSMDIHAAIHKKTNWLTLTKKLVGALKPRIALIHCFVGPDNQDCAFSSPEQSFRSFSVPRNEIPNIGWGMFYGDDFAKEVDEKAIAAAGFPIQKIGNGYLVQVTEDINDVCDNFPMFSKRRAELKSLFRDDLFLIKEEPGVNPTH
jgi:hypothetical protein